MSRFKSFGLIGTAIVAVALAAPASAERLRPDVDHVRTATVYVADLDLARESDARVLYARIQDAAQSLCMTELTFAAKTRQRQCVESAIDRAVDRVNVPALTAVHLRREPVARL